MADCQMGVEEVKKTDYAEGDRLNIMTEIFPKQIRTDQHSEGWERVDASQATQIPLRP